MDEFYNNDPGMESASAENNSEPETLDPSQVEVVGVQNGSTTGNPGVGPWNGSNNINSANTDKSQQSSVLAIVSLITGIVGIASTLLCCCFSMGIAGFVPVPIGIAGIVTGVICKMKGKPGQGMALGGIITGAATVLLGVGSLFFMILAGIAGTQ